MLTFLYLHRYALNQTDDEIYDAFIKLATGEMSKEGFFDWVERSIVADDESLPEIESR